MRRLGWTFAALVLGLLAVRQPVLATGRAGFIRFEGIAGDGGDAAHPGWFASQSIDVPGLGGSGAGSSAQGGTASVSLAGGGAGFDALVHACLARENFSSAEVVFGNVKWVLVGVAVEGVHVYGGSAASGGGAGKGPILVSFRYQSMHEAGSPSRTGAAGAVRVAPLLLAPTATPVRPR